jgi:hypothetical protein
MDMYKNIKTKENYLSLLNSGMFWEFHPELSGDWSCDQVLINDGDFKEHDVVVLKTNVGGIPKGAKGTIVFADETNSVFEVEFFDDKHNTIGVERIFKIDLTL